MERQDAVTALAKKTKEADGREGEEHGYGPRGLGLSPS